MGNGVSAALTISTGMPQGCSLSPRLLYTHDCISLYRHCQIFKFADDTSILGLTKGNNETDYRQLVDSSLQHGEENCLVLNTDKTKELFLDFRKIVPPHPHTTLGNQRYCGGFWACTSPTLSWSENTMATVKKARQRLYFIGKKAVSHLPRPTRGWLRLSS